MYTSLLRPAERSLQTPQKGECVFGFIADVGSRDTSFPVVYGEFFLITTRLQMAIASLIGEGHNEGLMNP